MREKLDETIRKMKGLGEIFIPYNFPQNDPHLEDDLNVLKVVQCEVDGYSLILHFSKADYGSYYIETLQVFSLESPFLPFHLVVKIARAFLGSEHLSLVELYKDNKKIYCWTKCLNKRGATIKSPYEEESEKCSFEGFDYILMNTNQVTFY